MGKPTTMLNSELPIDKLLELSKTVAPARYQKYYFILKSDSALLNSTRKGTINTNFIDITSIKGMESRYSDERVERASEGEFPVGVVAYKEYQLRELWKRHEQHLRNNGATHPVGLPSGNVAEDIACLAVNLKIAIEELTKMRKVIAEYDAKQETKVKATRHRIGGYQRGGPPDYRIIKVDGMAVDENGIIIETGQSAEAYLAEIKAEKEARRNRAQATA